MAAADPFGNTYAPSGLGGPAHYAATVTPDDSNDLATGCRALYVGTTGNIKLTTAGGNTVTFSSVPVGVLPVRCVRVFSTNTTASNIIALW